MKISAKVLLLLVAISLISFGCKRQMSLSIPDEFRNEESRLDYYKQYSNDLRGVIFDPVVSPETLLKTRSDREIRNTDGNVFVSSRGDLFIGTFKFHGKSLAEIAFYGNGLSNPVAARTYFDREARRFYIHDKSITKIIDGRTGKILSKDLVWEIKNYKFDPGIEAKNLDQENIEFGYANGTKIYLWNNGKLILADRKTRLVSLLWDAGNCNPTFTKAAESAPIVVFKYNPGDGDIGSVILDTSKEPPMLSVIRYPEQLSNPTAKRPAGLSPFPKCYCEDISPDGRFLLFSTISPIETEDGLSVLSKTYSICEYSEGEIKPCFEYHPKLGSTNSGNNTTETCFLDSGMTMWSILHNNGETLVKKIGLPDGNEVESFKIDDEIFFWTGFNNGQAIISSEQLFVSFKNGRGTYIDFNFFDFNRKVRRYSGRAISSTQRIAYDPIAKKLGICESNRASIFDMTNGSTEFSTKALPNEVFTMIEFSKKEKLFLLSSIQGTEYVKRELRMKESGGFGVFDRIFKRDGKTSTPKKPFIGKKYKYFASLDKCDYYQSEREIVEKNIETNLKTVLQKPKGSFNYTHLLGSGIFVAKRSDGIFCLVGRNSFIFYEFPALSDVWANESGHLCIRLPQLQSDKDVIFKIDPVTLKVTGREESKYEMYMFDLEGSYYVFRDQLRGQYFIAKWQRGASNDIVKHIVSIIRKYN